MESDEEQIRHVISEWHRLTAKGELEPILDFMDDDAVFLRGGAEPMGKREFAAGFREWAGKARIESKYEIREIHASGDIAYAWSYLSIAMTPKDGGKGERREGHVLTVFRKSPQGKWRLARDANLMK